MNHYFFVGLFMIFFSTGVFGSCLDPDLSIAVDNQTFVSGVFDFNLVFSADPPPIASCICLPGNDCGIHWQYYSSGGWVDIPSSSPGDLNCSGRACNSGNGYPVEDRVYRQGISCAVQGSYTVRGYHPKSGNATNSVMVYCYPSRACTPPETGSFFVNQTCVFNDVPVLVDGNYTILSGGHVVHNNSDVNFFSNGSHFLNIKDGGQIDLNKSILFAGLNFPLKFGGGLIGGILLFITIGSLLYRHKVNGVLG
ncbi:MAG: hypothetical protein V1776_01745 [Candidatus Diapherotrites archaeon]